MTTLVVLSGGQDSTTCLFWAKCMMEDGGVHAITFDYNQRHRREIEAARRIGAMAGVASHKFVELGPVLGGSSPLVNPRMEVGHYEKPEEMPGGIEPTFVPARNLLFLALAANRAAEIGAKRIVLGVSQEDYGGYPDCREEFFQSAQATINLALGIPPMGSERIRLVTPLMHRNKRQTVQLATTLPGCMDALAYSHTCYDGCYPPNPKNHASILRARGFREAALADPLIVRAKREGLLPDSYPDDGLLV